MIRRAAAHGRLSLRARLFGWLMRRTVRAQLSRATDPTLARARFVRTVRWCVPDPPGALFLRDVPGGVGALWASVPACDAPLGPDGAPAGVGAGVRQGSDSAAPGAGHAPAGSGQPERGEAGRGPVAARPPGTGARADGGGRGGGGASRAGGVGPRRSLAAQGAWAAAPRVILYLHGGAFVMGSPRTHRALAARLAASAGMRALLPRYRRAPEHPFPAALEDAMAVYAALLERGYPAGRIALAGDSAGGGIALALAAEIGRMGWPAPAAVVAFSPVVDLTFSGRSWKINRDRDRLLPPERAGDVAAMWLQGADPRDPRASPLLAEWRATPPPALLFAAETELLRDDAVRMAARLRAAGGWAEARIGGDLPHVWPFLCPWLPEACATIAEAGRFLDATVGVSRGGASPR